MPLTSGVTRSCEFLPTPSTRVLDDGRGPGKAVGDCVRLLSKTKSEGEEESDDCVSEGVTPTSPRRRVVGPMASTSERCDNSAPENEPEGVVSTAGDGRGRDVEGWSSNKVCTFRMRSSNTRPSKEISWKKSKRARFNVLSCEHHLGRLHFHEAQDTGTSRRASPQSLHSYLNEKQHATDAARELPEMPCELDVVRGSSFATERNRSRHSWLNRISEFRNEICESINTTHL
jgi:hypothetical protein